jgi:hypothetical protein
MNSESHWNTPHEVNIAYSYHQCQQLPLFYCLEMIHEHRHVQLDHCQAQVRDETNKCDQREKQQSCSLPQTMNSER